MTFLLHINDNITTAPPASKSHHVPFSNILPSSTPTTPDNDDNPGRFNRLDSYDSHASFHSMASSILTIIPEQLTMRTQQLSSLVSKNWTCFFRNKSILLSELFIVIIYYGILVALSYTVVTTVTPSKTMTADTDLMIYTANDYGYVYLYDQVYPTVCRESGYGDECSIGFTSTYDGCTAEVRAYVASEACEERSDGTITSLRSS